MLASTIACVPIKIQTYMYSKNSNLIWHLVSMYSADQTAEVTIISYKPQLDMNFDWLSPSGV